MSRDCREFCAAMQAFLKTVAHFSLNFRTVSSLRELPFIRQQLFHIRNENSRTLAECAVLSNDSSVCFFARNAANRRSPSSGESSVYLPRPFIASKMDGRASRSENWSRSCIASNLRSATFSKSETAFRSASSTLMPHRQRNEPTWKLALLSKARTAFRRFMKVES